MKRNKKIKEKQITAIILGLSIIAAGLILSAGQVQAQGFADTGFENICSSDPQSGGLARCVQQIYIFALGLAAVVALLMIVLAGYRYMTAQGNAQQVENAKDAFASSFIGLIIIFIAFILLYLINPDLVRLRQPAPPENVAAVATVEVNRVETSQSVASALSFQSAAISNSGAIRVNVNGSEFSMIPVANPDMAEALKVALELEGLDTGGMTFEQYSINEPALMPQGLAAALQGNQTSEVVVVVGSFSAFDAEALRQDRAKFEAAVLLLAERHFGVDLATTGGGLTPGSGPNPGVGGSGGTGSGGGSTTPASLPGGGGSFIPCTLEVFCEDPGTGERYEPGPSGCQGEGYDGPSGTRQVSECLYEGDQSPSCSAEIRFAFRNCQSELDSIRIGSTNNFDTSNLPGTRQSSGTLLAVPGVQEGSVNILCSYGDASYEAAACGAAMSGGFCETWFSNPGCIPR